MGRIKQRAAEIDKDVKRRGGPPKHKPRAEDMVDGTEDLAMLLSMGHQIRDGVKAIREDIRRSRDDR
jgi:hypothetical protein